jgi:hypothetical protein
MPGDFIRVVLQVVGVLEELGVPYAIGGSLSSSAHGIMRATMDADIIADLQPEHIQPFLAALSSDFYADEATIRDAIYRRSSFNLIHYQTAFKVDIFIPKLRPFDQMQLIRRTPVVMGADPGQRVYLTSPEDIILAKLEWYRMGGEVSDRQWQDVIGVLTVRADDLDLDYLHHWADQLGVRDLLERALAEAKFA